MTGTQGNLRHFVSTTGPGEAASLCSDLQLSLTDQPGRQTCAHTHPRPSSTRSPFSSRQWPERAEGCAIILFGSQQRGSPATTEQLPPLVVCEGQPGAFAASRCSARTRDDIQVCRSLSKMSHARGSRSQLYGEVGVRTMSQSDPTSPSFGPFSLARRGSQERKWPGECRSQPPSLCF